MQQPIEGTPNQRNSAPEVAELQVDANTPGYIAEHRFPRSFIVGFRNETHMPRCFSNKNYFVLSRFFLWKKLDNDIRKNNTEMFCSIHNGIKN